MLARLGDVLYWAGCLLAVLLVAAAIAYYNFVFMNPADILGCEPIKWAGPAL